jgi:hypothetical protein
VVSGPIIRNKTFWAFNFEHRLDRIEAVQQVNFPIDPFRQGDFSALLRGTVNPANGRLFRNPIVIFDAETGVPFPNNVIPRTRLHPGALNVLDKYVPRAHFTPVDPLDFTAIGGINQPTNARTYFGRVDHNFSDTDRVFARLALDRSDRQNNDINPNIPVFVDSNVTNLATQWIHTFSPSTINELRVGFQISDDLTSNPRTDDQSFDMDALGVGEVRVFGDGNRKLTPREHGIPQFNGLPFALRERTNGNGYDNMDSIQVGDHVSMFRGKHNLKAGVELYRVSMERGAANLEEGAFTFGGNESGYAFASFLLGRPSTTQSAEGLPLTFPRSNRWGAYINDDWKVSSKLTVNLGLRLDWVGAPVDSKGLWRTLDFPGVDAGIGRGQRLSGAGRRRDPHHLPEDGG